jgi:hypothetical protein
MGVAWVPSTLETYGAGLQTYHIFCNQHNIPEVNHTPTSTALIQCFISSLAGGYVPSTIENSVTGVHAWHIMHGLEWKVNLVYTNLLLKAASAIVPLAQTPRALFELQLLERIKPHLNLSVLLDAAVWACALALFFGLARAGELTTSWQYGFSSLEHPLGNAMSRGSMESNGQSYLFTSILIPQTKEAWKKPTRLNHSKTIQWAAHPGPTDLDKALDIHLALNKLTAHEHLFAYMHIDGKQ